jgi:formylglycine-generating enzyme required for sulfatase activity
VHSAGLWEALSHETYWSQVHYSEHCAKNNPAVREYWLKCCQADWQTAFRPLQCIFFNFPKEDLRHRLQAGLWLGDIGNNLMLERLPLHTSSPTPGRAVLGLKRRHWLAVGTMGQPTRLDLGDVSCFCPPNSIRVGGFMARAFRVTVAEWRSYIELLQTRPAVAENMPALPSTVAQQWLKHAGWCNLNLPATHMDWFEATAFTDFMGKHVYTHQPWWPLGPNMAPCYLTLPSEVHVEGAARKSGGFSHMWSAGDLDDSTPNKQMALRFNSRQTYWAKPSPVGIFPAAYTPNGIADASGNVVVWCANLFEIKSPAGDIIIPGYAGSNKYKLRVMAEPHGESALKKLGTETLVATRGGAFNMPVNSSKLARRSSSLATTRSFNVGLWWVVVCAPLDSGP